MVPSPCRKGLARGERASQRWRGAGGEVENKYFLTSETALPSLQEDKKAVD